VSAKAPVSRTPRPQGHERPERDADTFRHGSLRSSGVSAWSSRTSPAKKAASSASSFSAFTNASTVAGVRLRFPWITCSRRLGDFCPAGRANMRWLKRGLAALRALNHASR